MWKSDEKGYLLCSTCNNDLKGGVVIAEDISDQIFLVSEVMEMRRGAVQDL
jgi:hypothetical protein